MDRSSCWGWQCSPYRNADERHCFCVADQDLILCKHLPHRVPRHVADEPAAVPGSTTPQLGASMETGRIITEMQKNI